MAKNLHDIHVSTKLGIVIIVGLLVSIVVATYAVQQRQNVESHAAALDEIDPVEVQAINSQAQSWAKGKAAKIHDEYFVKNKSGDHVYTKSKTSLERKIVYYAYSSMGGDGGCPRTAEYRFSYKLPVVNGKSYYENATNIAISETLNYVACKKGANPDRKILYSFSLEKLGANRWQVVVSYRGEVSKFTVNGSGNNRLTQSLLRGLTGQADTVFQNGIAKKKLQISPDRLP